MADELLGHLVGSDPDSGERFLFFWRNKSLFSQWHAAPFEVAGRSFATAEQWMMAMKAFIFGDDEVLEQILATRDPKKQKALGRKVRDFDAERWNRLSRPAVYLGNGYKFRLAPGSAPAPLKDQLLETRGLTLVEASPRDRIWGIGLDQHSPEALKRKSWRGENRLGAILTELRDDALEGRLEAALRDHGALVELPRFLTRLSPDE